jgi:hypothetical protein
MATITKNKLSGSTDGRGILVAATTTPGTLIHTAVNNTTDWDELWLWAHNTATVAYKLTIEFGGTGTGDLIEITIPPESGLVNIVPGLILQNNIVVRAFHPTGSLVNIFGFVNSIDYP